MQRIGRWLLALMFRFWVRLAASVYQLEGVNVALLVMPTYLIPGTLRAHGAHIGERVRFRAPLLLSGGDGGSYYANLTVGNDCFLGRSLLLDLESSVLIEDSVTVSHRVTIVTHTDAGSSPLSGTYLPRKTEPVVIRRGAYIGANVTILHGVEIGECAVIGAGAVVTKSIPPHSVAVGIPATVIKTITNGDTASYMASADRKPDVTGQ